MTTTTTIISSISTVLMACNEFPLPERAWLSGSGQIEHSAADTKYAEVRKVGVQLGDLPGGSYTITTRCRRSLRSSCELTGQLVGSEAIKTHDRCNGMVECGETRTNRREKGARRWLQGRGGHRRSTEFPDWGRVTMVPGCGSRYISGPTPSAHQHLRTVSTCTYFLSLNFTPSPKTIQ